jgi:hypothetical protein
VNDAADNAPKDEAARRLAVRERATDAFVANYLHRLSDRHSGEPKPARGSPSADRR